MSGSAAEVVSVFMPIGKFLWGMLYSENTQVSEMLLKSRFIPTLSSKPCLPCYLVSSKSDRSTGEKNKSTDRSMTTGPGLEPEYVNSYLG